jgi:hypothetical protein
MREVLKFLADSGRQPLLSFAILQTAHTAKATAAGFFLVGGLELFDPDRLYLR